MYNGAAFILSPDCKYILLDSLTLENFNTAIVIRNTTVHLKNVRFKNCVLPVIYSIQLPADTSISGIISNDALLKIDSTKNIIKIK